MRQALNKLVNGKAGISPEVAIRLAKGVRQQSGDLAGDAGVSKIGMEVPE